MLLKDPSIMSRPVTPSSMLLVIGSLYQYALASNPFGTSPKALEAKPLVFPQRPAPFPFLLDLRSLYLVCFWLSARFIDTRSPLIPSGLLQKLLEGNLRFPSNGRLRLPVSFPFLLDLRSLCLVCFWFSVLFIGTRSLLKPLELIMFYLFLILRSLCISLFTCFSFRSFLLS